MHRRKLILMSFALVAGAFSGCRSPRPSASEVEAVQSLPYSVVVGTVRQVRPRLGYVVIECVSLPSPGERVTVYRDEQPVAELRITPPIRMPFAAADILSGAPAVGDRVKAVRKRVVSRAGRELQ